MAFHLGNFLRLNFGLTQGWSHIKFLNVGWHEDILTVYFFLGKVLYEAKE